MLPLNLPKIDALVLRRLCEDKIPESQTLDFKRDIPGFNDKDKHEFLKDVCAMANSDGGDLVYGIGEKNGSACAILPIAIETKDGHLRRLAQILDASLEPRVNGIQFHPVDLDSGYVLIIRVPASIDGPHRFIYNTNLSKFVMRNGTHTSELTYGQLKSAFDKTATLAERAKEFRLQRLAAIKSNSTSIPIVDGPVCVVHVLPVTGISARKSIDIIGLNNDIGQLMMPDWRGASRNLNLDGIAAFPSTKIDGRALAYTQIFRQGLAETVRYAGLIHHVDRKIIPSTTISIFFRDSTSRLIKLMQSQGISGPAVVAWTLLNVHGWEFGLESIYSHVLGSRIADRDDMVLTESWVDGIEMNHDIDEIAKPMLEILWQGFGIEQCLEYNDAGLWKHQYLDHHRNY